VDLGAGTGRLALAAANEFRRVIAVDVSPVMVHTIRAHAADARLSNVECVQAGFLTYEHTGSLDDGVYTRNALHQLPDCTFRWLLEPMLAAAGLRVVHTAFRQSVCGAYTCVKG
jgi:SAM-dependent methyltransferase